MQNNVVRCVGHDDVDIIWVSVCPSRQIPLNSVVVPQSLAHISDLDLMRNYIVKEKCVIDKTSHNLKKIAMISVYSINCGIATYTRYLCDEIKKQTDELLILAEDADPVNAPDDASVIRCWHRTSTDYSRLYAAVEKFNPDIIIIQHEFGLFPKLNIWNSLICQLSRWRVAVTFHTVLEHDVPDKNARLDYLTRFLAEAPCPEIIVHTPRARETLRNRSYSGTVHYIPHGCFAPQHTDKLPVTKYNMMPEHIVFQFGFGGQHKGWDFAINTIEILKQKYPDIIYIGIFNVSNPGKENTIYYRSLLDKIRAKQLENNVVIHRGFQSEETLKLYIRSSRIAFYPYQVPNKNWSSWGASGAIQLPMSLGIPMVLSDFPAFLEFKDRLPIVTNPQQAANEIDRIFTDPSYEKKLSELSFEIANERQWSKVAQWYLSIRPDVDYNADLWKGSS